jgi:hypothetical protein
MFVSPSTPDKRPSRVHDGISFFDTAGAARRDSKVSVLTKACRDVVKFGYGAVPGIEALNDRSSVTHIYGIRSSSHGTSQVFETKLSFLTMEISWACQCLVVRFTM